MHSPAHIIATALVNGLRASWDDLHASVDKWKMHYAFVPDVPDTLLVVYDTQGRTAGRIQETGDMVEFPGIQIMSRSLSHPVGYNMLQSLWELNVGFCLKGVHRLPIAMPLTRIGDYTIPAQSYLIHSVNKASPIMAAGQDEKRRSLLTLNFITSITPT